MPVHDKWEEYMLKTFYPDQIQNSTYEIDFEKLYKKRND